MTEILFVLVFLRVPIKWSMDTPSTQEQRCFCLNSSLLYRQNCNLPLACAICFS